MCIAWITCVFSYATLCFCSGPNRSAMHARGYRSSCRGVVHLQHSNTCQYPQTVCWHTMLIPAAGWRHIPRAMANSFAAGSDLFALP